MIPSPPGPGDAAGTNDPTVSDEAVRRLAEAVAHLNNDSEWFVKALTEYLFTLRPISQEGRLTEQQKNFLIESGTFTADGLAATSKKVDRGSLQLSTVQAWLFDLCATISLEGAAGFLDWDEDTVQTAVSERRLYAVEICGRLRFPSWQFSLASPGKLLPSLQAVLAAVAPDWHWQSIASFMATPQAELLAEGRKTPAEWLRDGGDVASVTKTIEAIDWR